MKYVPFAIIQAAQHYDPEATGFVRRHFAGYIAFRALTPFLDEHGHFIRSRTMTFAMRRRTPCLPLWAGFVSGSPRRTSPFSFPIRPKCIAPGGALLRAGNSLPELSMATGYFARRRSPLAGR